MTQTRPTLAPSRALSSRTVALEEGLPFCSALGVWPHHAAKCSVHIHCLVICIYIVISQRLNPDISQVRGSCQCPSKIYQKTW